MSCAESLQKPKPIAPDVPVVLVSAAALVNPEGRILIAQRPKHKSMGGMWEFPGGKVEKGELPEFTLMRELEEELGIETRPTCYSPGGFASHTYKDFHLLMPLFICRQWKGEPQAIEHDAIKWVSVYDLHDYDMPPADIPLISQLRELL